MGERQLAGRLCPDTGQRTEPTSTQGWQNAAPARDRKGRSSSGEERWGPRGACLVQKRMCRSPEGDAAERVGYRLQGSRRGSQAGHMVHDGLQGPGPERAHILRALKPA